MIVADSNLIAYLLIEGEHTGGAEAVLARDAVWAAPLLWKSEIRNILALYLRQGDLDLSTALQYMNEAEALLAGGEYEVPSAPVLELAQRSGCSAYDCEFVHLAQQLEVPLVTSDGKLLRAFPDVAISPRSFAQ
ncbi:type II toxin-antitoxin system VapC family toxin [soil metagenome]